MRPKGKALHDKFYFKVQSEMLNKCINENKQPIVTDWDDNLYFMTINRITFYIIPKNVYCLSERFIYPAEKLFMINESQLSKKYPGAFNEIIITGNQFSQLLPTGDHTVKMELKTVQGEIIYIMENALSLFPKQKLLTVKNIPQSPVFVLSSLKTLLGGVWPIKSSKIVKN